MLIVIKSMEECCSKRRQVWWKCEKGQCPSGTLRGACASCSLFFITTKAAVARRAIKVFKLCSKIQFSSSLLPLTSGMARGRCIRPSSEYCTKTRPIQRQFGSDVVSHWRKTVALRYLESTAAYPRLYGNSLDVRKWDRTLTRVDTRWQCWAEICQKFNIAWRLRPWVLFPRRSVPMIWNPNIWSNLTLLSGSDQLWVLILFLTWCCN